MLKVDRDAPVSNEENQTAQPFEEEEVGFDALETLFSATISGGMG
jgi:hypothetical protein